MPARKAPRNANIHSCVLNGVLAYMCETRPRALSSTMITYAEVIEWATEQGSELTLASLRKKSAELFPSLSPDFNEILEKLETQYSASFDMARAAEAQYAVNKLGIEEQYSFQGTQIDIMLLKFVVEEDEKIEVKGDKKLDLNAAIVEQADAGDDGRSTVTLSLQAGAFAGEKEKNKEYLLLVDDAMRAEWNLKYATDLLLKNIEDYLSAGSGGYGVSRATLNEYAESTFAGYCYPHAPKSVGAMVMVVTKMEGNPDSPHNQVAKAIEKHKAKDTSLEQRGSYLYQTLLQCNEKFALVQPMNLAVSGTEEPGLYCVENYVCPTPLFYNIGTEVYQAVLARARPKILDDCTCFEEMWQKIELKNDRNLERSLGATLYAETLLYTTTADAGLRFKDRQSTKMSVAKRNKYLWEFVRQLEASGFFTT